jgi:predicted amidohydrolase YtcJ
VETEIAELEKLRQEYPDDPLLKAGGVEIACGSSCDTELLARAITLLDKRNWQVMVRVSSESDVQAVREAFERAASLNPAPARERRYRIGELVLNAATAHSLFGSDWPAESLDPLDALEESVAASGELRSGIDAYTMHAAYATYDEQRKGKLAPGMLADIVILSTDVLESDSDALRDAVVAVTIFDGKIVYQRPSASSN